MNNEDRELLELAAKAVGVQCDRLGLHRRLHGIRVSWNPLDDDGDAFRLACRLGIDVFPHCDKAYDERRAGVEAATRRRITRAAAEIGRWIA